MSRKWRWILAVAVVDAFAFVMTVRSHEHFRHGTGINQTSVMTLGQAVGWVVSVGLLIVLLVLLRAAVRARARYRPRPVRVVRVRRPDR